MNYIYTTQTTLSNIKKAAKKRLKLDSRKVINLSAAIEQEAKALGYQDFHHANECFKSSPPDLLAGIPALPLSYQDWAASMKLNVQPLSKESKRLFKEGVLFAFDVKDAHNQGLFEDDKFIECSDIVHLTFDGFAREHLFLIDDDNRTNLETKSFSYNTELITYTTDNLEFYFPSNDAPPKTIEELRVFLRETVFFYPEYVWFRGRLIWMRWSEGDLELT